MVEVLIHIVELLHHGQRLIHKNIVHVEGMLRQLQTAVPEHLGPVDHGVHQDILAQHEVLHLIPAENPVLREGSAVAHDLLMLLSHLIIDKVADKHVHRRALQHLLPQLVQHPGQRLRIDPVVGIHHLEEKAAGIAEARIHRLPVSAVLLVHRLADPGVFLLILLRDLQGIVLPGAVIDDDDLHLIPCRQDALYAVPHIGCRIVAGNGKTD